MLGDVLAVEFCPPCIRRSIIECAISVTIERQGIVYGEQGILVYLPGLLLELGNVSPKLRVHPMSPQSRGLSDSLAARV